MKYPVEEPHVSDRWIMDDFIDLNCTPEKVWPWLAQMGNGRAGWYSYDWIDNLGRKSLDFVDPDLVNIHKDQRIPFAIISSFEINRSLTYQFGSRASMSYFVEETEGGCRLWSRLRFDRAGKLVRIFLGTGHGIMQKKQFKEIKKRVERISEA